MTHSPCSSLAESAIEYKSSWCSIGRAAPVEIVLDRTGIPVEQGGASALSGQSHLSEPGLLAKTGSQRLFQNPGGQPRALNFTESRGNLGP